MKTFGAVVAAMMVMAPLQSHAQAVPSAATATVDPERLIAARQVLDIGLPVDAREEVFLATSRTMSAQMRESVVKGLGLTDAGAITIMDDWLKEWNGKSEAVLRAHIPALMEGWAMALADQFSLSELHDLHAFVSTPTGSKFFSRQSEIMSNPHFAEANKAYMTEIMAKLPEAQKDLIERLAKYSDKK